MRYFGTLSCPALQHSQISIKYGLETTHFNIHRLNEGLEGYSLSNFEHITLRLCAFKAQKLFISQSLGLATVSVVDNRRIRLGNH